jgi:alkanesulfonate monooxygenase SsuD/methylene tetrahydromethanopterin reductase-like flavin-dependent oxidoreductase (luciferase family)
MTLQVLPWPTLAQRWEVLDASGFDSAWVGDHFSLARLPGTPLFEGWTLLAALAARTARIRLGPMVTTITYRNPALLAKQALTLDHIADGRLELGIGAGGNPHDHAMTGVPAWEVKERVGRFREFVEIVDALLRQGPDHHETTTYTGRYYGVEGAALAPGSLQRPRPPLTLAALGRASITLAARYADTWNSFVMRPVSAADALTLTRDRSAMLEDACAAVNRDPTTIVRSLLSWPFMPETPFASLQAFRDFVGRYAEIGIEEFIFYWSREDVPLLAADADWAERSLDRATLDWLTVEAIPAVRADRGEGTAR